MGIYIAAACAAAVVVIFGLGILAMRANRRPSRLTPEDALIEREWQQAIK
jgi:hypothetical protein